jgi:hypothetical protein
MANNTVTYGFVGLEHLWDQRVTEVGARVVYEAIAESAAEHTRQLNALLAGFVERTDAHLIKYNLPGSGTLQPLDEYGNPRTSRPSGSYQVAFPIQGGGDAWGANRVARAHLTVEEANRHTLDALRRDADWMRRHMLAAIFDNSSWTYDDPAYDNLTIQPLANGDTVTYTRNGGAVETDDHYLAQASSIDDSNNPFDDIYDELVEHPSNRGPIVAYVPTNLKASIEALTVFTEISDPDIRYGLGVDTIEGDPDLFNDEIRGFGDEVMGKANRVWIVEWRALPDSYIIAHARGATPPLGMREYEPAELQGFFPEEHSPDGNLLEMRMIRYAGFGAMNRVAALAYRIGNGSYAVPTGYDAPLPV